MRVFVLSGDGDLVRLEGADDVRSLDVVIDPGAAVEDVESALQGAGAGDLDGTHVELSEAWLRIVAMSAASPPAEADFDAMLTYARSRGWYDELTGRVRAHVVPNTLHD